MFDPFQWIACFSERAAQGQLRDREIGGLANGSLCKGERLSRLPLQEKLPSQYGGRNPIGWGHLQFTLVFCDCGVRVTCQLQITVEVVNVGDIRKALKEIGKSLQSTRLVAFHESQCCIT